MNSILNLLSSPLNNLWRRSNLIFAIALLVSLTGCLTPQFSDLDEHKLPDPEPIVFHEGDSVRITFAGAHDLNTVQQIKRDGTISLQLVGEVHAAGLTAKELETELLKRYAPQLQNKEVMVAVEASAFPVYVTGAVLHPGKILCDQPMTALKAIMEAGGFDYSKANEKAVTVIRHEGGKVEHFKLNLKGEMRGEQTDPFDLKSSDIIFVPERFAWF